MTLVHQLPHVNASLNAVAAVLLIAGYICIRRRNESAHKWLMLASFLVSILFLTTYVIYHWPQWLGRVPAKRFPRSAPELMRYAYYAMLLSHVVLAAAVPFLASWTIYLGLSDQRARHRRWARWTFPIWLYVSITGVLVYFALYWAFAEMPHEPIIELSLRLN